MKINELVIEAVKQRLDPKCWKGKHKEGTKIKGGVRVNNCVPNESIEESKVKPSAKYLKLADALEDYANKHIPKSQPGFGDFMYHAELIRKGHQDVHKQDLNTVQQKYRKTMGDMIKQHLDETRISEGLTYNDPVSKWIAVFKASTHPKFKGKTAEQREKMARMAQYKAVQNKKPLSESKKRKAKTLIDGMIKSLIKQGRTHDEAVADLKRQVDSRFYEHIDALAAMITEHESNADSINDQRGR